MGRGRATDRIVGLALRMTAGSLTEPNGVDTVNCGANEIVEELSNLTGSGFDSANLFCAPARCM